MIKNWKYGYWICQIGGWSLLIAASAFINGLNHGFTSQLFLNQGVAAVLGISLTHLFRTYVHRAGWKERSPWKLTPRVLASAVLLASIFQFVLCSLIYVGVLDVVAGGNEEYLQFSRIAAAVFGMTTVFLLWSVIYFGLHYFRHYRQAEVDKWKLEARAETARLKALKLQLNPHFFFNSLNSVRALIAEDPERAQRMVTRLARLLRTTLQVDDVKTVPLEEELSTVRTYLKLERVRFEERLQFEIDAAEEALQCPVPLLLLQTLVENGIKHGIATRQEGGVIRIGADVCDDALHLRVTNPGTLESEDGGIGLQNTRERLQLLFGDDASLALENGGKDTVVATAHLPLRTDAVHVSDRALPARAPAGVASA